MTVVDEDVGRGRFGCSFKEDDGEKESKQENIEWDCVNSSGTSKIWVDPSRIEGLELVKLRGYVEN